MQQFINNKYVRLAGLTLGLGLLFWAVIWLVCMLAGLQDFPPVFQALVAFLGAGALVYKFLSNRVF